MTKIQIRKTDEWFLEMRDAKVGRRELWLYKGNPKGPCGGTVLHLHCGVGHMNLHIR